MLDMCRGNLDDLASAGVNKYSTSAFTLCVLRCGDGLISQGHVH